MRRTTIFLLLGMLAVTIGAGLGRQASAAGVARAGVGVVDATWHVGASAGQYAGWRPCDPTSPDQCADPHTLETLATFDEGLHSTWREASYGIQSRLSVRGLVVEGANGTRWGLVKNDLYIPQDLLWRRTAEILETKYPSAGIGHSNLTMTVTHNHSSPYYSSPSWGVWTFQDVFDVRFYEYYAQKQAQAVALAASNLVPVRLGASVSYFDKTHRHSFGPSVADDGTPAGYPNSDADHDMMVARIDDISTPGAPKPLAILANFGLHPEFLSGNNLITGDYIAPLQRLVGRETGATLFWTQNAVGTAEPERSTYHSVHERLQFSHQEYQQAEYGARLMADAVEKTWGDIDASTPQYPGRFVPFQEGFDVRTFDRFFPGPLSHPIPTVSNCRTDRALAGNPQLPLAGLPDCTNPATTLPFDPGVTTDTFEQAGIPVPENYSASSYTGLEEDIGVHLQAVKLGDLLVTVCSCEQWKDQAVNIKTRTDRIAGNEYHGFNWSAGVTDATGTWHACTLGSDSMWHCPNPQNKNADLPPISDLRYRRMVAQVNNNANGWNDPAYVAWAESEPADPSGVKGNFTQAELPVAGPGAGYGLTMTVSMANDYNGYLASYREYQRGDHYRKALTGWGPHSEDYMATRLVDAGGELNGGAPVAAEPLDAKEIADQGKNDAEALVLGTLGATYLAALDALLPADGGPAEVTQDPEPSIERFGAALFSWIGGGNYTDSPLVRVERNVDGVWQPYADQSGEIPLTLKFPTLPDAAPAFLTANLRYEWTATFEAFDARKTAAYGYEGQAIAPSTPAGTYRFVVDGTRRGGTDACPDNFTVEIDKCSSYHFESRPFDVGAWTGITANDLRNSSGDVSFVIGPVPSYGNGALDGRVDYPDTYSSPVKFIVNNRAFLNDPSGDPAKREWFCNTCSFRPWADSGLISSALVTRDRGGVLSTFAASLGSDGRWHASIPLLPGDQLSVQPGGVTDEFGNYNSAISEVLGV